jgi:hypothetical protein
MQEVPFAETNNYPRDLSKLSTFDRSILAKDRNEL